LGDGSAAEDTVMLALQNLKDYKKEIFRLEEQLQTKQTRVGELEREKANCPNIACIVKVDQNIVKIRDQEIQINDDIKTQKTAARNSSQNLNKFLNSITCNI
jgi:hypothetical protein